MLKKMILINSAEFDYAEIDLSKDMFFAGDNGTGKTSSIIALFYLFSGDNNSKKLGISSDKKSFKEYYFPDERNSFIIYIFDGFFIFMYKQNEEVFKHFSKQDFDIKNIVQANGSLENFKSIQRYIKDAPLTYLSKSSEYREIIYGQNRHYLDFKITNIKNYNVFVELFNQTFNVDKSIVDATSIKRAIQKSLNIEEKNIEFNYQKYMEQIKIFQESYLFFRKFEKESDKISQSFKFQEELLTLEEQIDELSSNILYRQSIEVELLEEKTKRIVRLEEQKRQYLLQREQKEKSLNRLRERFAKEIATLENDIKEIEKLKIKFQAQTYKEQLALLTQLPFLEKEHLQKQQQLTLLEADSLNALNAIDQEILDLSFKRDNDLAQQKRLKSEQLKAELAEQLSVKKEQLRQEREHTQHRIDANISEIKIQIDEQELKQEEEKSKANDLHNEYREKLNTFSEKQFSVKKSYQNKIESQEEQHRTFIRELSILDEEKTSLTKTKNKEQKKLAQALWEERQHLNLMIKEKKNILFTEEGSFKEFLQQSGLSWEKELYPFMDASLLSMSVNTLSPKVINAEQPLGLELSSNGLKTIPTQEEAEESIREAKVKKQQFFQLYKEEKRTIQDKYNNEFKTLENSSKKLESELASSKKEIEQYKLEITKINTILIPEYEAKLLKEKEAQTTLLANNIHNLIEKINTYKKKVNRLNQELKDFTKEQQVALNTYQNSLKENQKKEQATIDKWLKNEINSINKQIEAQKESRNKLSKDDVIHALKKSLTKLSEQVKKSHDAKYYLESYENSKEFIDTLPRKKSRLIMSQQNRNNLENKLSVKQQNIIKSVSANQEALIQVNKEIEKLQQGLEKSKNLKLEAVESKKTNEYLSELINKYKTYQTNHKELRVNLKEILSRINSLKNNPFNEISFKLENFSIFDKFSEDFETIEKLYDLKDFKNKQFEPLKQATNEEYLNFIKNEIPSKLGSLSHSEDKFQEQVSKINKNLSSIDFSIIKNIKIKTEIANQRSVMTLLGEMNSLVQNLTISDKESSLFFDKPKTNQDLQKIANLLTEIKETLKGGAITLLDTIDLSLEFVENGTTKSNVTQIKNESSTGGTILLKMALAVSILGLYTKEEKSTFFLILDEVSRLHSHNQDLLRSFANSRGFRIVFVTPEPVYAKPDEIKYYKFMRRDDNRFEIIGLNG
ncbi:MAG: Chromosome partition protein smc [uncultured Sulfurovum sp.]|uniref:Chromosome partition protein smc n=1 Tax=uncultured Sulfurovum sp. TaxID=269237 RepID=A0A6S6S0I5_9BACT|nr:MAG: Chromosome partition protein smc [uncultured Sulfurovum sp.]